MKLIINADDAGIDVYRNRGIFDAIDHGVVTSISVIVAQAGWKDLFKRLTKHHKKRRAFGVGLHLNLTAGKPLIADHKTLAGPDGYFFNKFDLFDRAMKGKISEREVAQEFKAQLFLFKKSEISPSHIDGHNHVHLLPGAREGFLKSMPKDSWVRLPFASREKELNPKALGAKDVYGDMKYLVKVSNFLSREAKKSWGNRFRHVDDFGGIELTPFPTLGKFQAAIEKLQGRVCELMCHPGATAQGPCTPFSKLPERQRELKILKSAGLQSFLKKKNIELISYRDIAQGKP